MKIKVSTFDSYQGEESQIVLLSLVRSNNEHSIGFLRQEHRISVLLSRAKDGLYIVGNMTLLSSESTVYLILF